MSQVVFLQGDDLIVELPIIQNSTNVDLTTATSLRVQLYVTQNNVPSLFAQYSSTPKSGYGVCRQKTGSGNTNIIQVLITRAQSVNFPAGILSFAAITTFPGSSDFPQGINTEYDFGNYGTVNLGLATSEIIP